jgi:hypothetical protein
MAPQLEKVSVVVRVRPPRDDGRLCVRAEGASTVLTHDSERQGKALRFHFSRAFFWDAPGASTTQDVFEVVGKHLLHQALSGYHCSLLAYGQTGVCTRSCMPGCMGLDAVRVCGPCRVRAAQDGHKQCRRVDSLRSPPRQRQDAHPVRQRR